MSELITEKMEAIRADWEQQFTNLYCKKDFVHQLDIARTAASDRKPQVLSKLAAMYNAVGIACEYGKPFAYYESLFPQLQVAENVEDINNRIINTMFALYVQYPKPEEFMQRIVNRLDPETMLSGSLELRILRRFLQTVNVKENKKYFSKILGNKVAAEGIESIDESVFLALTTPPEEECDYLPLLRGCYNLAHGIFISPISTKVLLFLFAFAYDMRYFSSPQEQGYAVQRDVEKNLFVDYYCDNLTRYLASDFDASSGSSDNEPSGIVINPKNFVDAVFVYFLNRNDLTPPKKVSGFFNAVTKITSTWKAQEEFSDEAKSAYESVPTKIYRNKLDDRFFAQTAEQMIQFVLENYYCDVRYTYVNKKTGELSEGSKGAFELSFASNTAFTQYLEILALIKDQLSISEDADFTAAFGRLDHRSLLHDADQEDSEEFHTNTDVKYRIELKQWYEDDSIEAMSALSLLENTAIIGEETFFSPILVPDENEKKKFVTLIQNIEKRLNAEYALCVNDPLNITRTKLIAAYYHYFCLEAGSDALQLGTWRSFKDVYAEMGGCVSAYLSDAGYQRISPKNLFDMFVIFLAYCKVNDFLS